MSACTRCGAVFTCAVADGSDAPCWCMALPPVMPLPGDQLQGCLCPECLRKEIDGAALPGGSDGVTGASS